MAPKAKASAAKAKAKAAGGTSPSNFAASPSGAAAAAQGNWLDDLTPEELEREKKKKEDREKKAKAASDAQARENAKKEYWAKEQAKEERKKTQEDRKWEAELAKDVKRAKQQGVVEAYDYGDGVYWADLGKGMWKEVKGNFFCTLCEKHLHDGSLACHLDSEAHRKKVAWQQPTSGGSVASTAAPSASWSQAPSPSAPLPQWSPGCPCALENWQEIAADGFNLKCKPCGKVIDENHLATADHKARLERWQQATAGYKAPKEPYLAFVPYDENDPESEKACKCLLCNKWCQDETSHSGSRENPAGSKEHQKNLRNCGPGDAWWQQNVTPVRQKWHPETAAPSSSTSAARPSGAYNVPPTPAPWATSVASSPSPAAADPWYAHSSTPAAPAQAVAPAAPWYNYAAAPSTAARTDPWYPTDAAPPAAPLPATADDDVVDC